MHLNIFGVFKFPPKYIICIKFQTKKYSNRLTESVFIVGSKVSSYISGIIVQYSDKFMHSIVLYSIVLRRSQLYCIVNLLLCGYNTMLCINLSEYWTTLISGGFIIIIIIAEVTTHVSL